MVAQTADTQKSKKRDVWKSPDLSTYTKWYKITATATGETYSVQHFLGSFSDTQKSKDLSTYTKWYKITATAARETCRVQHFEGH